MNKATTEWGLGQPVPPAAKSIAATKQLLNAFVVRNPTRDWFNKATDYARKAVFVVGNHYADSAPDLARLEGRHLSLRFSELTLMERRTLYCGMEKIAPGLCIPPDRHPRDIRHNID